MHVDKSPMIDKLGKTACLSAGSSHAGNDARTKSVQIIAGLAVNWNQGMVAVIIIAAEAPNNRKSSGHPQKPCLPIQGPAVSRGDHNMPHRCFVF